MQPNRNEVLFHVNFITNEVILNSVLDLFVKNFNYDDIDKLTDTISNAYDSLKIPTIVHIIESIDKLYRDSKDRKKLYTIHDYRYRTLITTSGTITFRTTYYKRKKNDGILNSYYCYILDILNVSSKSRLPTKLTLSF